MRNPKWLFLALFLTFIYSASAQHQPSSALYHDLLKLKETKRILYVAAHPDDENTRLIAYLANAEHAQVAYLSLTRGDGGQNLIGKELGIELGYIRTHELLKARETDGGRQFFSRAMDFGFSKNPDETLNNWDRERLLGDVVWIIRNFQPDIIINRFNDIPGTTHGHHTTSAILSLEAFEKAADPKVFPDQLGMTKPWKAKRVFWNAYNWGGQYEPQDGKFYHRFSVGEYNPLLGHTYSQIAADSRTMHKSQGFGSTSQIGAGSDFIELVKGERFQVSPFDGIPNRWEQIPNGKTVEAAMDALIKNFDFIVPENNLDGLLKIKKLLDSVSSQEPWVKEKQLAVNELIFSALGIKAEFTIRKEIGYPGEKVSTEFVFNNPSSKEIFLQGFDGGIFKENINLVAKNNIPVTRGISVSIPENYPISQPFWLENGIKNSFFDIKDMQKIGPPVNEPSVYGVLSMLIDGQNLSLKLPLRYKYNDQVDGEIQQPFTLVPQVNVSLDKNNIFLIQGADQVLRVEVSFRGNMMQGGKIEVQGLKPNQYQLLETVEDPRRKRMTYLVKFLNSDALSKEVVISYVSPDGRRYNQDTKRIMYKHIPNLTYFNTTSVNLVKMDVKTSQQRIAYIPGAGDDVPEILRSLGYQVSILEDSEIKKSRLDDFQTVIVGIRAFNVNQALADHMDQLMEYVKDGGNMIVQINTSSPLLTRELGPFPFSISRDRVTVENSPVKADFNHPIFSYPNKITESDFDGWVQERGLYFVSNWDAAYQTPLTLQEPGEDETQGALIFANYGKGTYTYSGISWFRQLPAGVPGAVKIFVNLIEQGNGK